MVSFSLLGLQHPEPNGSRRATPTSTFQHRPGHPPLKLKTAEFRTITRSRHLSSATRSAEEMFLAAEPLLACEADGRAFRLVGIGAHDLVEGGQVVQGGLFGAAVADSGIDRALDAVRDKFGDDAIVRGRGFGSKLRRQGPSNVE